MVGRAPQARLGLDKVLPRSGISGDHGSSLGGAPRTRTAECDEIGGADVAEAPVCHGEAGVPELVPYDVDSVAPELPASSLALATVLVPASSSSVSSGNITDVRVFTAARGGIIPVPSLTTGPDALTGYQGKMIYDRTTQRYCRLTTGGEVVQPILLPVEPQLASQTGTVPVTSSYATMASLLGHTSRVHRPSTGSWP